MVFSYSYQVQFKDTDGAGVVYFSRFLEICHGGYEASLAAKGIVLQDFFSGNWKPTYRDKNLNKGRNFELEVESKKALNNYSEEDFSDNVQDGEDRFVAIAVPIVETQGKFYRPCVCGDFLTVNVQGQLISEDEFKVNYRWWLSHPSGKNARTNTKEAVDTQTRLAGVAMTRHVCISVKDGRSQGRYQLPPVLWDWLGFVGSEDCSSENSDSEDCSSESFGSENSDSEDFENSL